jgi:hypothetical protein
LGTLLTVNPEEFTEMPGDGQSSAWFVRPYREGDLG